MSEKGMTEAEIRILVQDQVRKEMEFILAPIIRDVGTVLEKLDGVQEALSKIQIDRSELASQVSRVADGLGTLEKSLETKVSEVKTSQAALQADVKKAEESLNASKTGQAVLTAQATAAATVLTLILGSLISWGLSKVGG